MLGTLALLGKVARPELGEAGPDEKTSALLLLRSLRLSFLLGGFILRDERWLEEYDEQRRGSCDAACSVPSLCWEKLLDRSWERLDQMKKLLPKFSLGGCLESHLSETENLRGVTFSQKKIDER